MEIKKNTHIQLRVTAAEKRHFAKKAEQCNLSLSEYVRVCVDNNVLQTVPRQVTRDHLQAVAKVGNGLSDLLAVIESEQLPLTEDIRALVSQLGTLIGIEGSKHDR